MTIHIRGIVRGVCAAGMMLVAAASAPAQQAQTTPQLDPARVAAAKALFEAMDYAGQASKAAEQMRNGMLAEMAKQQPSVAEKLKPVFDRLLNAENPMFKSYVEDARDAMIAFYAGNFTVEEIAAVQAFQASPIGRKFQALAPQMGAALSAPLIRFQQRMMPEMMREIQAIPH